MTDTRQAILAAAYNGVCLAAENGETDAYGERDVTEPKDGTFTIMLRNGKRIHVTVSGEGN